MCRFCGYTPSNLPEVIADYLLAKNIIGEDKFLDALLDIRDCINAVHRINDVLFDEPNAFHLTYTLSTVFLKLAPHMDLGDFENHQSLLYFIAQNPMHQMVNSTDVTYVNVAMAVFDAVLDYQNVDYMKYAKKLMLGINRHVYAEISETAPINPQALVDFIKGITGQDDARGLEEVYSTAKDVVFTLRKDNFVGASVFNKLYHLFNLCAFA